MKEYVRKQAEIKKLTREQLKGWLEDGHSSILSIPGASVFGDDSMFVKAEIPGSGITHLYNGLGCKGQPDLKRNLNYVGFYDFQTGKIHGNFTFFSGITDDSCKELYGVDINNVNGLFKKDVQDMMKSYAFQNELYLKDKAERFFNENGLCRELDSEIEEAVNHVDKWLFLRDEPICFYPPNYDEERLTDNEVYEYIISSEEFVQRKYDEFISAFTGKSYIRNEETSEWANLSYDVDLGQRLIIYRESQNRLTQLKNGADKRMSKLHDIIHAVKELHKSHSSSSINNVKITLKRENDQVDFTYPVSNLLRGATNVSDIREKNVVPIIKTNRFLLSDSDTFEEFDALYIAQISYRRKVFYKNKEDV